MDDRQPAIIADLDGTMAKMNGRGPYNWERVNEDTPNIPVITAVHALALQGFKVIYTSGRLELARSATMQWLQAYAPFDYDLLLMRPVSMRAMADDELKLDMYRNLIEPFYRVLCVYDDRDKVVRMWRETAGLPCFQVAPGNF